MRSVRTLLSECIDYAGLFPPAALDLDATVTNYAAYRNGPDAWALGKLILPASKLRSFASQYPERARDWPLSAIVRGDFDDQTRSLLSTGSGVRVEAIECGPVPPSAIAKLAELVPEPATAFVEVQLGPDLEATIRAIAGAGMRAKIRTGGTSPDAIPAPEQVARFIACCLAHNVSFKATAGLHHAIRGAYALTYEQNSARAPMYGFLNVLLATALLAHGGDERTAISLLQESSLQALAFDDGGVRWRDQTIPGNALAAMRKNVMVSFGSCSFAEPMEELRSAGLIA